MGLLVVTAMVAFPRERVYEFPVQEGDVWRGEDLASTRTFPIFRTDAQVEAEYARIRAEAIPFFKRRNNVAESSLAGVDSLSVQFDRVFEAYTGWKVGDARQQEVVRADSLRFMSLLESSSLNLTSQQWTLLIQSYAQNVPELASSRRVAPGDRALDQILLDETRILVRRFAGRSTIDIPKDSLYADEIAVLDDLERSQSFLLKDRLSDLVDVNQEARQFFESRHPGHPDLVAIGRRLFAAVFEPTLSYQRDLTESNIQARLEAVSTTHGVVREGEVIVRNGEVVTEVIKSKLNSLSRTVVDRGGRLQAWLTLLGQLLISLIACTIFFLFLFILRRNYFDDNRDVVLMSVLLAIMIGLFAASVRLEAVPNLAIPVAIASVLLTVFYDSRVGVFGTLSLALLGGVYFGNDFKFITLTIWVGTIAVFSVRDIKRRAPFITTAILVFFGYGSLLAAFWLFDVVPVGRARIEEIVLVAINAVLVLLAQPLVLIFERLFGMTTDVTLLELSDTNRDVLRELSVRAPGSFNHSLQVANLSEAAADAIGANALLARVGALYHDIGKMQKPEYFIENQQAGFNPHDRLKPRMSALIVASHVRDGFERAKDDGLPKVVRDFIPMHHGTARMEYFYNKALRQTGRDDSPPSETEFRYPGPRPDTRETGIVMLADSVEAASRSIDQPTPRKLENLVDSIFESRIGDGQLDFCPLTFADLNRIKETILSMLSGMHHFRVKYPGQEDLEKGDDSRPSSNLPSSDEPPDEPADETADHDRKPISP
ncbi:MAG: HD family phosphohydrolase, partial [Rhodothermia bacterium]